MLRSTLVLLLVLSGLGPTVASAQCEGVTAIEGEADLVRELTSALMARGIVLDAASTALGGATVRIEALPSGGVRLELRGPDGSSAAREVARVTTAAMLIESWTEATRMDLLEPPPVTTHAPEPPAPEPAAPIVDPVPTERSALGNVAAHGVAAFGNEGSSWFGAQIDGCAQAGPVCLGGAFRYLSDSGLSDGTTSEGSSRTYLGGDLAVSLPFHPAPDVTLTPALALGLGWLESVVLGAPRTVTIDGLRAIGSASFAGAVALIDWLSLELRLAVTWSPLAHQSGWAADGASFDPDPVVLGSVLLGLRAEIR